MKNIGNTLRLSAVTAAQSTFQKEIYIQIKILLHVKKKILNKKVNCMYNKHDHICCYVTSYC